MDDGVLVPSAALRRAHASRERWQVPLELVLPLTNSDFREVVIRRYGKGRAPEMNATVFAVEDQLFAQVDYLGPGKHTLVLALNVRLWDRRYSGLGGFTPADGQSR